ncbi:MAG: phytanoyl-CoA dioxygenase family protein [Alphaproteobacteria bacterium]|nr:phytanoyl-CoA dioxygenase family protein [Alphaproteobacteria bacterium]
MPKRLTDAQVRQYHDEGYACPIDVLTPEEVRSYRAGLEAFEKAQGKPLDFPEKSKTYLLCDWADAVVHHPAVLDAVEDVLGPNILIYHLTIWIKEANTPAFVHWHQDGAYFFLEPDEQVTAWVALSEASELAGCMRVIPGSNKWPWMEHQDDPGQWNMIKRGQGVLNKFRDDEGVLMPLKPGQMSFHNTKTMHASWGNRNNDRRIGFGISYIPTHVRPHGPVQPSALLVRGEDKYNHYVPERRLRPGESLSASAREQHADAVRRFRARQDSGFVRAPA